MRRRDRWIAVAATVVVQWMLFNLLRSVEPAAGPGMDSTPLRVRYIARAEPPPPSLRTEVRVIRASAQQGSILLSWSDACLIRRRDRERVRTSTRQGKSH